MIAPSNIERAVIMKWQIKAITTGRKAQLIKVLQEHGEQSVTELYIKLRIDQAQTSQLLSRLQQLKLVVERRDGKYSYYSINKKTMERLNKSIKAYA